MKNSPVRSVLRDLRANVALSLSQARWCEAQFRFYKDQAPKAAESYRNEAKHWRAVLKAWRQVRSAARTTLTKGPAK